MSTAYEIVDRQAQPYASVCYVRVVYPDGSAARASAVVVGINDVLTALHVMYEASHGGWATSIELIPGADTWPWSSPFGSYTDMGTVAGRASNWDLDGDGLLTQAESANDLALIGLKSRIGDVTGWLPVTQQATDFYGVMAGYPATGSGMMAQQGFADASSTWGVYDTQGCLGPGASGGPLLIGSSVAGVLSAGTSDGSVGTYAGLFTADTWYWLHEAVAANDYLVGAAPMSTMTSMMYAGTAASESFTGGSGWDTFAPGGGNDSIDGGVGVDTAVYSGIRGTYAVSVSTGMITVADGIAARDGNDTLRNVERVKFSDLSMAFDVNGSAGEAYRLYQAAFNRVPDLPGLGYQMKALDDGLTITQLAGNFLASPEFQRTYGTPDDATYVQQLYANVLHRSPDPSEVQYHVDDMHINGASRAQVLVHFSDSPENQAALVGVMQGGMLYTV